MNLNLQVVLQLSDAKLSFRTQTRSILQELNANTLQERKYIFKIYLQTEDENPVKL